MTKRASFQGDILNSYYFPFLYGVIWILERYYIVKPLMEKPKLKKSKTLSINIHEIESKAFSKSMRRRIPSGMSCSFVLFMLTQHTGQLSITQKQDIITCIPKGDKPRQFMSQNLWGGEFLVVCPALSWNAECHI
jgi:hypothetical protein